MESVIRAWQRALRARNLAQKTIDSYRESVAQLVAHAGAADIADLDREAIESFLGDLADRAKPTTVSVRYRALQQLFKWCVEEEILPTSPMERMKAPVVPDVPVPVLGPDELRRLLGTCASRSFDDVRDRAILSLFIDTGVRLAEMAGLRVQDVDDDNDVLVVLGKGRRPRSVPFSTSAGQALDRYRRARKRHPWAARTDALWLGLAGPMTDNGVGQLVRRRGREAGIEGLHPHQLRHTFAHAWLSAGGNEGDLQRLAGWKSPQMLRRYGASAADARARDAHRKFSPLENLR